jgi:protein TonB
LRLPFDRQEIATFWRCHIVVRRRAGLRIMRALSPSHRLTDEKGSNDMQNLNAMHLPSTRPISTRYPGIAFAALVNGVAIWAIINGLHFRASPPPPQPTTISFVKPDLQPTPAIKPPQPVMVKPATTTELVVPKPDFKVDTQPDQTQIATTTQTEPTTPQIPDSAASGMTDTHSTPPYPAAARNLSQQGTVTLMLSIDATGAVTNAQVKNSSGYPELDQTAVNWVIAHWRYKPAIQNGAPVASTSLAAVKFDLRQAR